MADAEEYYYRYLMTSELASGVVSVHRKNMADYFWKIFSADGCGRVADVGCGIGFFLSQSPSEIATVGIDSNRRVVEHCRAAGLEAALGDAGDLPLEPGSVDGVMCSHVLEHLPACEGAFREFHRVLADQGLLVVRVPPFDRFFYDDWTHVRPFSRKTLERLAAATGFTPLRIYYYHYDIPLRNRTVMKLINAVRHLPLVRWLVDRLIFQCGFPPKEIVMVARKKS